MDITARTLIVAINGGVFTEEHISHTLAYLHDSLKHWDEDKLDESDLSGGFGDFVSVHEGSHGETLRLLPVALGSTHEDVFLIQYSKIHL